MTTPAFVAQNSSTIPTPRFYTQFDPYYYSVDNRPLTDLDTNIRQVAGQGGDSARRAALISQLNLAEVFRQLYTTSNSNGLAVGLGVTNPTSTTIQILPGALYATDVISTGLTTQVLKQNVLLAPVQFSVPAPSTSGQSINYLVQIAANTLTTTQMLTTALPYLDSTNTFLPGLLLNGELTVGLKAGVQAATGSQVTPTADSGYLPLYVVTTTYGVSAPTVAMSTAATVPAMPGLNFNAQVIYPLTGAATTAAVGGLPVTSFVNGSNTSIVMAPTFAGRTLNPFAPIKVKMYVSSTATTGNAYMQLSYLSLAEGGSTSTAATSLAAETVSVPGVANTLVTRTLTGTIPPTAFAGFVSNTWGFSIDRLNITLTRNGSNGSDTLAAPLYVHDVILTQ